MNLKIKNRNWFHKPKEKEKLSEQEHSFSPRENTNSITQPLEIEIDMFYELTKDIRNLKPLTQTQLNYIQTLPKEKILELLEIYILCFKSIEPFLKDI